MFAIDGTADVVVGCVVCGERSFYIAKHSGMDQLGISVRKLYAFVRNIVFDNIDMF